MAQKVTDDDRIGNSFCGTAEQTEQTCQNPRIIPYTYCPLGDRRCYIIVAMNHAPSISPPPHRCAVMILWIKESYIRILQMSEDTNKDTNVTIYVPGIRRSIIPIIIRKIAPIMIAITDVSPIVPGIRTDQHVHRIHCITCFQMCQWCSSCHSVIYELVICLVKEIKGNILLQVPGS